MTIRRSHALLGASLAALLIATVPFGSRVVVELGVLDQVGDAPLALTKAELAPEAGRVKAPLADFALPALNGAAELASAGLAPMVDAPPIDAIPEEEWPGSEEQKAAEAAPAPDDEEAAQGAVASAAPPETSPETGPELVGVQAESKPDAVPPASPVPPAAAAYRKGDVAALTALARAASNSDERLALEWAALRVDPHPTFAALEAFANAHPTWPGNGWIRYRQEADLLVHPPSAGAISDYFAGAPPQSSAGKLAAARALAQKGQVGEAIGTVRELWREGNFDGWTEAAILRDFGPTLIKADHKYRADRLLYAESFAAAMRAATLAGPDEVALAQARTAAARGPLSVALVKAVPQSLKSDPGLLFARIQDARRSGRAYEAATLLSLAPTDHDALINSDRWWSERRMVARELLDLNEPKLAFEICANAVKPTESASQVDAEFHAGWIALRFLGDASEAAKRFALAAEAAETPLSIARAAYWRGRAADALGKAEEAKWHYESAASEPIAYYGQLAAVRLGFKRLPLREPTKVATGAERDEAVRAVEALYQDGLDDLANALAYQAAREWRDEAQMAAMAEVVKSHANAATQVQFGKIATLRGYPFDEMAFPASGVPAFLPLANSADLASVYAVARQESEFVWHAASGAGAKGLMQILPSTAASTARRAGVAYDAVRLIKDPAFNTQLGAAFLGQMMRDIGGAPELAFAAYNAGPGRVLQWIAAYGDPRKGKVDPVDWVERIPFEETRDYVQRVSENLAVYRQRFAEDPPQQGPLPPRVAKD
ncbi:MAG TPA: lytic transglycosylase domain-containing protein [Roseiarcus sp.]|nr:lytic transglycosylase domain-containing protein [Roseiarcus sp.]